MAEPEVAEAQELEVPEVPTAEKEKPKKAAKVQPELPKEPPDEISLQTADGQTITFTKKRPVGRPKKEAKSGKEPKAKARPKKVVVKAPDETPPPQPPEKEPEKENEPPPEPLPLVRMSGKEKLEEHMRLMQELRCSAKESQRVKYRAMLRA